MKKVTSLYIVFMLLVIFMNSCSLFDAEEPIPSYLYIEDVELVTGLDEGSNSEEITEVWVSVNSQLIGAFPLPATIPVLETGEQNITIFAGVIQNGTVGIRDIYPFYERIEVTTVLEPGKVDTIKPVTQYVDETVFVVIEDFETTNLISDEQDGNINTKVITTTNEVFEGNRSGHIILSGRDNLIEVGTNLFYEIDEISRAYIELDYKNDVTFEVGISGVSNTYFEKFYKVGVLPSEDWKKIYIDFGNDMTSMISNSAKEFQVVLRALHTDTTTTANIYLDNIKLMYR